MEFSFLLSMGHYKWSRITNMIFYL